MEILGVLLAFVGFALGIYEIINTLRGKENKRVLCGVVIAYLGYGVFNSVSQKDLRHFGVAFLFGLIFYAIKVLCGFLRMVAKHEKRSFRKNLIVLAVLLVGFIAGMMLPYDKAEEAKRAAESNARMIERAASSAQSANSRTDSEAATGGEAELQHSTEEITAESGEIEKISSTTASLTDDSKEIKSFLKRNKEVSETFARNLEDALSLTGLGYTLDDISWFEQTDDWTAGKRYNAQINMEDYIQIATIGDEIYSIKNTQNSETDKFLYRNENLKPDAGEIADGSILLTDGELGAYGKEVTTKSGYKYVWYTIPTGNYTVENKAKQSTVFVVSDSNSDDVSECLKLASDGEKTRLTVKDGYHIELSMYAQVLLIPRQ
jgi:type II secretory pathway pseudopilin PulG